MPARIKTQSRSSCLLNILEALYKNYNRHELIAPDPLQWVYHYKTVADMEIAAFFASGLAYGRVDQINKSLQKLFALMGPEPSQYIRNFGPRNRKELSNFKHRFNTGQDIADLIELLQFAIDSSGSLEKFFLAGYDPSHENIIPALESFSSRLRDRFLKTHKICPSMGLAYFLSNPEAGSACKRLNLFLRWMVRKDDVDTGIWTAVDPAKLLVPLDVHMGRLTRILGFHQRNTISLATALDVTAGFKELVPEDPVKYDFALSRIGIVEHCTGKPNKFCTSCKLLQFCTNR